MYDDLIDSDYDIMIEEEMDYNAEKMGMIDVPFSDRIEVFCQCCNDVLWQSLIASRFVLAASVGAFLLGHLASRLSVSNGNQNKLPLATSFVHFALGAFALGVHFDSNLPVFSMATEAVFFFLLHTLVRRLPPTIRNFNLVVFVAVYIILLEFVLYPEEWHAIRGCHMILAMKLVSFIDHDKDFDLLSFLGYCFSPTTCVYGPWISYDMFVKSVKQPKFNIGSFIHLSKNVFYMMLCLLSSTCVLGGILFNDNNLPFSIVALRDSYSFILSNFFVSYLSTVIACSGGILGITEETSKTEPHLVVSKPFDVLVPHSLTQLVIAWSIPMHTWLRRFVFRPIHSKMGPFIAVLATYLASALLHGVNAQIAVVLLTVGFFTYIEYNFRARLAKVFDACVGSRPCEDSSAGVCHHKYDLDHPVVRSVNVSFSFYAAVLFAYSTSCFGEDSEHGDQTTGYSLHHLLYTWSKLNWFGHAISLLTFLFNRFSS